jgi:hypothetical protein
MKRRITALAALAVLTGLWAGMVSAASARLEANKQRISIEVKAPLNNGRGSFILHDLTAGRLKVDFGSITSTRGPTPVFLGEILHGQRVDRFRGTDTLRGRHGTLVISLRVDFVSAGNGWQIGNGTWSIVSGTGAYAGQTGGGRSAFVHPPPPGRFGFAEHDGYVSAR